jgi:hypothetical protein
MHPVKIYTFTVAIKLDVELTSNTKTVRKQYLHRQRFFQYSNCDTSASIKLKNSRFGEND